MVLCLQVDVAGKKRVILQFNFRPCLHLICRSFGDSVPGWLETNHTFRDILRLHTTQFLNGNLVVNESFARE